MTEESADYTRVAAVPGTVAYDPFAEDELKLRRMDEASRGATAVACGRTVQNRRTVVLLASLPTSLSR